MWTIVLYYTYSFAIHNTHPQTKIWRKRQIVTNETYFIIDRTIPVQHFDLYNLMMRIWIIIKHSNSNASIHRRFAIWLIHLFHMKNTSRSKGRPKRTIQRQPTVVNYLFRFALRYTIIKTKLYTPWRKQMRMEMQLVANAMIMENMKIYKKKKEKK